VNLKNGIKNTKSLTAAELKQIATKKALAALAKLGVKPTTETDPIQLEAARLNLIKQNNIAEQKRVEAILANLEAQLKANEAIKRYTDLLGVVADSTISNEEVVILAAKWGISKEAVIAYTTAIFAVNDGKISTTEVENLAKQWGVTKQQAGIYLDFFQALNDGKLDQTEINNLMIKWNLTTKQVEDYATLIAKGVTPSDLWPQPGDAAKKSWEDALKALNNYIAKSGSTITPTPQAAPAFEPFIGPKGGIGGTTISPTVSSNEAVQATFEKVFASNIAMGGTQTQAATLALSSARYEALAASYANRPKLAEGGIVTSPTTALIGEAGPEAVIPLNRMGSMGGSNVNIVVNGSVTSEGDLVNAIRNAILQGQNNGQAITKTAIQL
jgi:hypothetical protein